MRVYLDDREGEGLWADLKDPEDCNAGDRRAMRGAVPVTMAADPTDPDGERVTQVYPGDYDEQMKNALLARIITAWNLQHPVPKGDRRILDKLSLEQIDRLYEAVKPHVEFLNKNVVNPSQPGTDPTEGSSS